MEITLDEWFLLTSITWTTFGGFCLGPFSAVKLPTAGSEKERTDTIIALSITNFLILILYFVIALIGHSSSSKLVCGFTNRTLVHKLSRLV